MPTNPWKIQKGYNDKPPMEHIIGYHVTTPRKSARYQATGCILAPVRFWRFLNSAIAYAHKTGQEVILEIKVESAFPLPDHKPRGHAWWSPWNIQKWRPADVESPREQPS